VGKGGLNSRQQSSGEKSARRSICETWPRTKVSKKSCNKRKVVRGTSESSRASRTEDLRHIQSMSATYSEGAKNLKVNDEKL